MAGLAVILLGMLSLAQEDFCGLFSWGLVGASAVNATLNLLTVALIAYVTKITHKLDKEVIDGGE